MKSLRASCRLTVATRWVARDSGKSMAAKAVLSQNLLFFSFTPSSSTCLQISYFAACVAAGSNPCCLQIEHLICGNGGLIFHFKAYLAAGRNFWLISGRRLYLLTTTRSLRALPDSLKSFVQAYIYLITTTSSLHVESCGISVAYNAG
jgi:hypothetical protein